MLQSHSSIKDNTSERPGVPRKHRRLVEPEVNAESILALPDFFTTDLMEGMAKLPDDYCYTSPLERNNSQIATHATLVSSYLEEVRIWLTYAAVSYQLNLVSNNRSE